MGKVFKKLNQNRLNEYDVLTSCLYGFRKQKSTIDAILELTERILENSEDNVGSMCTLIDLTKAFNTIDHKSYWKNANNTVNEVKLITF